MLPAPQALAAEGTPPAADYITVAADGAVTLHSTHMAAEGVASLQLTLNGAAGFEVSPDLADRLTHVRAGNGSVTVYIAGAEALMSGETLVLGTVTPTEGIDGVKLAKQSLKYVYGPSAVAQNFEDEEEPIGDEKTPEEARADLQAAVDSADALAAEQSKYTSDSWNAFLTALSNAKNVLSKPDPAAGEMEAALADLAAAQAALVPVTVQEPEVERGGSGGAIYDGYDDGTGSGAPEPTGTPEPTASPAPTTAPVPENVDVRASSQLGTQSVSVPEADLAILADAALTDAEKELARQGTAVTIELRAADAGSTIPAEDKTLIDDCAKKSLPGYTVGQYLDLAVIKTVGAAAVAVTDMSAPVSIVIDVPEAMQAAGRTFRVIRLHGGEADVLDDLDSDAGTVTIRTDRFSVYAIAYADSAAATPSQAPVTTSEPMVTSEPAATNAPASTAAPTQAPAVQTGNTGPQAPATGDETALIPWALTLCVCGALLAAVLIRAKRRQ